jgi:hypothetical protein
MKPKKTLLQGLEKYRTADTSALWIIYKQQRNHVMNKRM